MSPAREAIVYLNGEFVSESEARVPVWDLNLSEGHLIRSVEVLVNSSSTPEESLIALVAELCLRANERNLDAYGALHIILKRMLNRRHSTLSTSATALRLNLPNLQLLTQNAA